MGVVFYGDESYRILESDAQMLAIVAARFNARGEPFTVRIAGGRNDRESWLTVNSGIPLRVVCEAIPMRSGDNSPYSDRIKEVLDVANDEFNLIAVKREPVH